jgi:hypothetical protein
MPAPGWLDSGGGQNSRTAGSAAWAEAVSCTAFEHRTSLLLRPEWGHPYSLLTTQVSCQVWWLPCSYAEHGEGLLEAIGAQPNLEALRAHLRHMRDR